MRVKLTLRPATSTVPALSVADSVIAAPGVPDLAPVYVSVVVLRSASVADVADGAYVLSPANDTPIG